MFSETSFVIPVGVVNVLLLRFNGCTPLPLGALLSPTSMNAVLVRGSMATPQFSQDPPENPANALAPLVSVLFTVVPVIRYTSVLFATHTLCAVTELEEQEFTTLAVEIAAADPLPSMGTNCTP